jgi:hypothetical protein
LYLLSQGIDDIENASETLDSWLEEIYRELYMANRNYSRKAGKIYWTVNNAIGKSLVDSLGCTNSSIQRCLDNIDGDYIGMYDCFSDASC